MTENGTYHNDNNAVLITSQALADNYTSEFEEMVARQFGPDSPTDTPYPRLIIAVEGDGESQRRIEVETYFSPEDDVDDQIIDEIGWARRRIRFMAFVFTSDAIADAMLERAEAGVVVQGVMESRNVNGQYDEYQRLRNASHDVLLDGNPYIMHHKVIIIDDETVILGSYNFSRSAEISNDENVLIIHDPAVAALFVEEFGRIYQEARAVE
jgi:phosphatidylserine/phosphatidylglycerophosphate/cardiolipin synthase-like enzyme